MVSPTVPMPTLRGARLDKIFSGSKCGCLSLEEQPYVSLGTSRYDKLWEKGVLGELELGIYGEQLQVPEPEGQSGQLLPLRIRKEGCCLNPDLFRAWG